MDGQYVIALAALVITQASFVLGWVKVSQDRQLGRLEGSIEELRRLLLLTLNERHVRESDR